MKVHALQADKTGAEVAGGMGFGGVGDVGGLLTGADVGISCWQALSE